ncbi:MAG TPA: hypothetical protein VIH90_02365 [Candidatus Saccharimonadales bacterium]
MNIGIIDGSFPQKEPFGFRNREINGLLAINQSTKVLTAYTMYPEEDAFFDHSYGMTRADFNNRKKGYLKYYPQNHDRIHYLQKQYDEPFLAFSYFLAETYTFLPFIKKNKLPFCFVLYPGGGFGINNPGSDAMLIKIFSSPFFRKVIVTSDITEKYLCDTVLCDRNKIEMLWCGVPQFESSDFMRKTNFPESKKTLDVLFVAYKYSDKGYDKCYDVYIETAKRVIKKHKEVIFHVVGNFSDKDYDISAIESNVVFHGVLTGDELKILYNEIDIQIGLSRSNVLFDGNFDGFPLGFEAMRAEVLLMASDDLDQNGGRFSQDELCVVTIDANEIATKIFNFFENPSKMRTIAMNGMNAINKILNTDIRVKKLDDILTKEALNE